MADSESLPPYTRFADVPPNYDSQKALDDFNALSPDQKKGISHGFAQAVSRSDAVPELEKAANAAAEASKNIDDMFVSLTAKLMSLEDTETFVEKFRVIQSVRASSCESLRPLLTQSSTTEMSSWSRTAWLSTSRSTLNVGIQLPYATHRALTKQLQRSTVLLSSSAQTRD